MRIGTFLVMVLCTFLSCERTWLPLSTSPDGDKQIFIAYYEFADAAVYVSDNAGRKMRLLFGIAFSDYNERISKFCWSPDGSKVAWLISGSSDKHYTYGKRLIVFDTMEFPDKVEKIFDDPKHDIIDFELSNDKIVFKYADEAEYKVYEF